MLYIFFELIYMLMILFLTIINKSRIEIMNSKAKKDEKSNAMF